MNKKYAILIVALGLVFGLSFTGFSAWRSAGATPKFETGGYVLQGEADEVKWLAFQSGEEYVSTLSGAINFTSIDNGKATVSRESFVHFDDGSMMALSDGILLDFNDLSENFINNYYINAGLRISESGDMYTAETTSGSMKFGEHIWKLSDQKFMVTASSLKVHLSDDDIREVNGYVQVTITDDKVVHLLTPENLWVTISEQCFIETVGGVKVYPVTQLIDNGTYKLSLAKLSVSVDDAIVLTEDETRRQIVPELNIESIDGEDGEDGADGQVGRDGEAGEAGTDGEAGETGTDGEAGQDGANGENGANGNKGANGSKGATGTTGRPGVSGSDGKKGPKGPPGKSVGSDSTTNTALPTMTISDWKVSATDLKGTITITDNGGLLGAIRETGGNYGTQYPGKVTITNVRTGEAVPVYWTNERYVIIDDVFDFYRGADQVYFSTSDALEPDTEYKLSVTAYYKAKDQSNLIYSREFISRIFYTDSTGVVLAYETATDGSLTISASVSSGYQDSIEKAIVFLLTPEQNKTFSMASIEDATQYTGSMTISSDGDTDFVGGSASVMFGLSSNSRAASTSRLDPNTRYIARVYVEVKVYDEATSDLKVLKVLTSQELSVMTLKRNPTVEQRNENQPQPPRVFYNRATGAFEVFRPMVVDPDGGAESYTYTAYYLEGNAWKEGARRTITPSTGEPVEFRLQSGTMYKFAVEMAFNDNEKVVYFDLGESESVQAVGDTMPKVTLTEPSVEYNRYSATLNIALGQNSSIQVDHMNPLKLEFYADQILSETVVLENSGVPVTQPDRYRISFSQSTNELDIQLDQLNLYKNTNYSITVSGALNVGDENGFVNRAIGTVSFRTYAPLTLSAAWTTPTTVNSAFERRLQLSVQDSQATAERTSYAVNELKTGQVTVELFSGTGTGKIRIAQKNFNQPEDLNQIFSTGLSMTENDFGSPQLNRTGSYTLTVSEVVDKSYQMNLGYVNNFENILNASEVVAAEPTPPDLLTDSSKGVAAKPILNVDAAKYGVSVDPNLPDDAIVGYTLAASYDNVQRIGKSITYYAFEYNAFINALSQGDPIRTAEPLMKMTQAIDDAKDTVPKIALLFGGTKTGDEAAVNYNGYQRYFAGAPNQLGTSLTEGMGRGYRYIFAYTVEYAGSTTGETLVYRTYPYDHRDYANYQRYYGGVKENNVKLGTVYILHSGMCEAPVVMPDFHTYVYSSTLGDLASPNAATVSGDVTIHYTWRDPDGLIITGETDERNTKLSYVFNNNTVSEEINKNTVSASGNQRWYGMTIPYTISSRQGDALLVPTVNISEYHLDYSAVLSRFGLPLDVKDYPLANIPLDWSWENQFAQWSGSLPLVQIDTSNLNENYLSFRLVSSAGNSEVLDSVVSRAVAMRLTIQPEGGSAKKFVLSLTSDISGTYAKLATGQLGAEFLGKAFTVTDLRLLYDTGTQGWLIAEQQPEFTMQNINQKNSANEPDTFKFAQYIGTTGDSQIAANGALLSQTGGFSLEALRNCVAEDHKMTLYLKNMLTINNSASAIVRYLYPDHMGVDVATSNNYGQFSGEYAVPKKIGSQELIFSGGNTGVLTSMTPTMTNPIFTSGYNGFNASSFSVSGFSEGGSIMVAVYDNQEYAYALNTQYLQDPKEILIDSDGYPTNLPDSAEYLFGGLQSQKKYYVAFYYHNATEDKDVLLLKSDASGYAVYSVTTSGGVTLEISDVEYLNNDYFDKKLIVHFTVSRTYRIALRYDIYGSQEDANNALNPVLSHQQMVTGGADQILFPPPVLSTASDNTMTMDLTPDSKRKDLKPGTTYYLKITAMEDANEVGSVIQGFELTAIGNYGALIYVKTASKDSITYQVTINDPQNSFMGRPNGTNYEGALYAVRFTDSEGKRLYTTYDGQIFSANELRKEFVLNDTTLINDDMNLTVNKSIKPNQIYQLHVYAVPDDDHDGQISILDVVKKWMDFFKAAASEVLERCGEEFHAIINSFWNGDTTHNQAQAATEAKILIASKSQSTTTDTGWLLNEDGVYASRYNPNTVRIVFQESVGLIAPDDEPVFKRIDWSVSGMKGDGSPLSASGIQRYSDGDMLLTAGQIGGYNAYYFDIPYGVGQGNYTIVLHFYQNESDTAPTRRITVRSGV